MTVPNRLVFDLEIAEPLPEKDGKPDFGRATECGVSVLVTWGAAEVSPYVHLLDSVRMPGCALLRRSLQAALKTCDGLVSWNGAAFDNACLEAKWEGWRDARAGLRHVDLMALCSLLTLDLGDLREQVLGDLQKGGVPDDWARLTGDVPPWQRFQGLKMTEVGEATVGVGKPVGMDGARAPDLWGEGKYDAVISYAIRDVAVTRALYIHAWEKGYLLAPGRAGSNYRTEGGRVVIPRVFL